MSRSPMERAARALCELAGNPPGATMGGKPLWMDYLPEVRAVVTALREPSEATTVDALDYEAIDSRATSRHIWCAMIDALLAETL